MSSISWFYIPPCWLHPEKVMSTAVKVPSNKQTDQQTESPAERALFLKSSKRSPWMSLTVLSLSYAKSWANPRELEYADWLVLDDLSVSSTGGIQPHLNYMDWEGGKSHFSKHQILRIGEREKGCWQANHNTCPIQKYLHFWFLAREDLELVHLFQRLGRSMDISIVTKDWHKLLCDFPLLLTLYNACAFPFSHNEKRC